MKVLVPLLWPTAEVQEGYLICGRFRLRGMAPKPQDRLLSPKHQSQEAAPTQHQAVKSKWQSFYLPRKGVVHWRHSHLLKGPTCKILFTVTYSGLQWREVGVDQSCLSRVWGLWLEESSTKIPVLSESLSNTQVAYFCSAILSKQHKPGGNYTTLRNSSHPTLRS